MDECWRRVVHLWRVIFMCFGPALWLILTGKSWQKKIRITFGNEVVCCFVTFNLGKIPNGLKTQDKCLYKINFGGKQESHHTEVDAGKSSIEGRLDCKWWQNIPWGKTEFLLKITSWSLYEIFDKNRTHIAGGVTHCLHRWKTLFCTHVWPKQPPVLFFLYYPFHFFCLNLK